MNSKNTHAAIEVEKAQEADFQASGPAEAGDPLSAQASLSVPKLDGVVEEEPESSCSANESHSCASLDANASTVVIATNTSHEEQPVRMFQAAQQRAKLLEDEIEKLKRNEKKICRR